jgi:signal transduction histidine kinase
VQDNGPGILPEDHDRIFERFYRGDAGLQSGVPGTGLGLPIAFEIIRRHDGLLELDSSGIAGEGTTFTVWLPIYHPLDGE